jgi:hypothetical protein
MAAVMLTTAFAWEFRMTLVYGCAFRVALALVYACAYRRRTGA